METKLNGYILREKLKEKMRDTLRKTQQSKVELGFSLCSKSDNIIRARGYYIGSRDEIEIDPRACKEDEKYLGAYHTHPRDDSRASARDLRFCGLAKMICTGGNFDSKIRCYTWKYEQPSPMEINKIADDINKDTISPENLKFKQNFDCLYSIGSLYSEERKIKEKLDKDLDEKDSRILDLKNSGASESKIMELVEEYIYKTLTRDSYVDTLKKEIENESKKYYEDIEIK